MSPCSLQNFLSTCPSYSVRVHSLYYGKHRKRYFNTVAMVTNGVSNKRIHRNFIFPNRKSGFNKRTLKLSVFQWPTFYYKTETGGTTTYDGVVVDLFTRLQSILNFQVEYTSPPGLMSLNNIMEQFEKEVTNLVTS
ncbi:hypothetical protein ElyMa_005914700 [Elysia marginata]|uniref:Uncharacterized protein n=1 Tax=Elysia marginata TaxID=1093978 RepID=A0AAV4G701_9GAST|nr:hypothetical protein ElyMa_005914700 [Elysia marginata]